MMNSARIEQALQTVGSPQKLVNLVGKRVRELSSQSRTSQPLIKEAGNLQQLDIALEEIIQRKITYERFEGDQTRKQSPSPSQVIQ